MRFKEGLKSFKLLVNHYTQAMSFHLFKLSMYEPKKKRAQSTELSSNTSLISRLPNYLMHYVLQWNDPSTIYHVGVSVTLHWFILTRSILAPLSPTVLSSKIFYSLKSWSYFTFLIQIMILLLCACAKILFLCIVSSLAAFWRVFFLLGAHVVLLARTWADWTDEKFTWMEKIRSWCIHDAPFTMT